MLENPTETIQRLQQAVRDLHDIRFDLMRQNRRLQAALDDTARLSEQRRVMIAALQAQIDRLENRT
ncbi:MAG: hypothetical protein AMXMBFR13_48760 [Phycisphaerae bacterium]